MVDFATGDGRYVLRRAEAEPATLVIGVDANRAGMARGFSRACRGRLANVLFVVASAEAPPPELAGQADELRIHFPWGSLLRGLLLPDPVMVSGLAGLVKPTGRIVVCLSVNDRDGYGRRVVSPAEGRELAAQLAAAAGARVDQVAEITSDMAARLGSTWAKRLGVGRSRMAVQIQLRPHTEECR